MIISHFPKSSLPWNPTRRFYATSTKTRRISPPNKNAKSQITQQQNTVLRSEMTIKEFPLSYPDFLPSQIWNRRDKLYGKLVQADMLERRMMVDIPEFYVGSIMAVTISDPNLANRVSRFVGICIRREKQGLQHTFTLRNTVDGLGVEMMYEMYNPTILKIETLLLEKRLDEDLSYLSDALPEYSTFDFHMEPVTHPAGKPVPLNEMKVKLKLPPWSRPWFQYDIKGIEDSWTTATPWFKRKFIKRKDLFELKKFDIIRHYREMAQELEYDLESQRRILDFEEAYHQREGSAKKRILKSASGSMGEIFLTISANRENQQ